MSPGTLLRRMLISSITLLSLACSAGPEQVRDITQETLLSAPASTLILDVRTPEEFSAGHVPNAINIPHDQVEGRLSEIASHRDSPVVVYCERGGRAGRAATVLAEAGFSDLQHLDGDMIAWRANDRPVVTSQEAPVN